MKEVHEEVGYPIVLLCDIAEVTRAAYYKWLNRKETNNEKENKILITEITKLYEEVSGIYGYRRMTLNINKRLKKSFNHKRIHRLMRITGLKSVIRRKKRRYVKANPQQVAENLLNREFKAENINQKWLTDVTEFKYGNSKAYLSAIIDLYDKSIVSYVLGHSNNNRLVFKTLDKALENNPGAAPMIHSDRGFQVRQEVA
nr:IS3 family transposase [Halanaerobium salsuginis]